jgi:hypothetical protein
VILLAALQNVALGSPHDVKEAAEGVSEQGLGEISESKRDETSSDDVRVIMWLSNKWAGYVARMRWLKIPAVRF